MNIRETFKLYALAHLSCLLIFMHVYVYKQHIRTPIHTDVLQKSWVHAWSVTIGVH